MAQRRLFSPDIVESDAFLDMPVTSQALYFHLGMHADDDGFVGSPRRILRSTGCNEDDLKILAGKRFLLTFPAGIVVIKHWRINNWIRPDRYKETRYLDEKKTLFLKENGAYTDHDIPNGNQLADNRLPQVKLSKVNNTDFNKLKSTYKKINKKMKDDDESVIDAETGEQISGGKPKKGRNIKALKICDWYGDEARKIKGTDAPYEGGGYFQVAKVLQKMPDEKVREML